MRKIIVSTYVTLDGVIQPLDWSIGFRNEERGKYARDLLFASDALLMGRETYNGFAPVWSSRTAADDGPGEAGYTDGINSMPKFVVSTTLKEPLGWNTTLIKGDLAEAVAKLKQQPGRRLFVRHQAFPGYRCRACDRYYTLLTNTAFAKIRQRPAHPEGRKERHDRDKTGRETTR